MTTFAGVDVKQQVADAFTATDLPILTLTAPGTDTIDPKTRSFTEGTRATYTVRGVLTSLDIKYIRAMPEVVFTDRQALIALGTLTDSTGAASTVDVDESWQLSDDGVDYKVIRVLKEDPAGATRTLQVRR